MKKNEILEQLDHNSFCVVGDNAYGHRKDFPVEIARHPNSKKIYYMSVTMQVPLDKADAKELRHHLKERGVKATVAGRVATTVLTVRGADGTNTLMNRLDEVISALEFCGVKPPYLCGICGDGGADTYMMRQTTPQFYDVVHASCMSKMQNNLADKASKNPGNYLTGILGALLGALVGMLPALLGIYYLNVVSGWLFMLLPIATYYGYKLLHGKMNIAAPICSVVFSLFGLCALLLALDVMVNFSGYTDTLEEAISYTFYYTFQNFSLSYWSWLGEDLGSIIVFYVLGLAFSFGVISNTNKSELKSMEEILKTRMPIVRPGAASAAPATVAPAPAPALAENQDAQNG
ncbi:MAG: hypothetical protein PHO10_11220 [Gemmiger sp.]|nr:hypothetical protein [Gemmiger sp.]